MDSNFHWSDYLVLTVYLFLLVALGWYFSRKEQSTKDFFLGGQRIPFWAAGISIMATQVSSIGFMAIPAKAYDTDWSYFTGVFTWFIVVPIVIYAFIPFYRRLNVTSAYEYLEKRFDYSVRFVVAILYCIFQLIGRMGVILYLPALALSSVTGIDTITCILIMGILSTLYTVLGGMEAVIWTDVLQAIVLFGGAVLCIAYVVSGLDGGIHQFFELALADHKFSLGSLDWDFTNAVIWVVLIGNIFNRLGSLTSDQSVVQRYLTTSSEKEAKKALWVNVFASIPWAILVYTLGTALYVFYLAHPNALDASITTDSIVPFFIGQNIPIGIKGLIIAGIFAASMSSLDSSMHSVATVIMTDFLQKQQQGRSDQKRLQIARGITAGLGLLATIIALIMTTYDIKSLFDLVIQYAGLFGGAMTGFFILGIFTQKANASGVLIGGLFSGLILWSVKAYTDLHLFLYGGVGMLSCLILGYLFSLVVPGKKQLKGLTIFSIKQKQMINERN